MLEEAGVHPPDPSHPLLVEVRMASEREQLPRGYVACVQALRAGATRDANTRERVNR
jgi:hypothetical protein